MASLAAACLAWAPPSRLLHAAAAGVHADRRQAAALTRGPKTISRRQRRHVITTASSSQTPSPPQQLEQTWSNPTGAVLTELIPGKHTQHTTISPHSTSSPPQHTHTHISPFPGQLWVAERPFVWASIDVGGKTAVARLRDGSLFVHSPLALDDGLERALAGIGPRRTTNITACPGLAEKKPQINFSATVGESRAPPAEWQGDIELEWFNSEHNPFTRTPFFNEPSRTLFTADLFWSYPGNNIPSRTWLWSGMDRVYLPFYKKFMITRPELFKDSLDRVLAWDWDALLPCHGKFVPTGGKQALKEHYGLS
eukprot:jgi/Chlat1/7348/Chrsp59S06972